MSCEKCRSNEHHMFRREYSRDAKQMGRAMYNMLLNGLLDKSQAILTVPINPEFGSLNLAQAVMVVAYEWSKGMGLASPPSTELDPPAPQSELDGLIGELEDMLSAKGYFWPEDRVPATRRTLRNLLTKPGWNSLEIRTLRGVLSSLKKPARPRG